MLQPYPVFTVLLFLLSVTARAQGPYFPVAENNAFGLIDSTGQMVIEQKYDRITFDPHSWYFQLEQGAYKELFIHGNLVPGSFESSNSIEYSHHLVDVRHSNQGKTWHTVHSPDRVFPMLFEGPDPLMINNGISDSAGKGLIFGKRAGFYRIFDLATETIHIGELDSIVTEYAPYTLLQRGQKWALMNLQGGLVTDFLWDEIQKIGKDLFWVAAAEKQGIIDGEGDFIIEPAAQRITKLSDGAYAIQKAGKWGLTAASGKVIVEPRFQQVRPAYRREVYWGSEGPRNWSMIKKNGEIVPLEIWRIDRFKGKVCRVLTRQGLGLVNVHGEWVIPADTHKIEVAGQRVKVSSYDPEIRKLDDEGRLMGVFTFTVTKQDAPPFLFDLMGFSGPFRLNQNPRSPRYRNGYRVPGTSLVVTCIRTRQGEIRYGLIDGDRRVELHPANLAYLYADDFRRHQHARARLTNGKYILLHQSGNIKPVAPNVRAMLRAANTSGIITFMQGGNNRLKADEETFIRSYGEYSIFPDASGSDLFRAGHGKWGYFDLNTGSILETPTYSVGYEDYGAGMRVATEDGWGVLDSNFQKIVPCRYTSLDAVTDDEMVGYVVGADSSTYGFIDTLGRNVFGLKFNQARNFSEGLAAVRSGNDWGFLDRQGNMVFRPQFKRVTDFHEGRAWGWQGRKLILLTAEGNQKEMATWSAKAGDFSAGRAALMSNSRIGYVDRNGDQAIEARFYRPADFDGDRRAIVRDKRGTALIDPEGNTIIRKKGMTIVRMASKRYLCRQGNRYFLIDENGQKLWSARKGSVTVPDGDGLLIWKINRQCVGIDVNGQTAIAYDSVQLDQFHDGYAVARKRNTYGLLDQQGNWTIPLGEGQLLPYSGGVVIRKFRGATYYLTVTGDSISDLPTVHRFLHSEYYPQMYEKMHEFGLTGWIPVAKDIQPGGYWTRRNSQGYLRQHLPTGRETFLPIMDAPNFQEGLCAARLAPAKGLLDAKGNTVLPPVFHQIQLTGRLLKVTHEGNIGYCDLSGNWLWKPSAFDELISGEE